ncbi:hypothetical protein [Gimesia aquarii]|uniref:Hemerythrin-like domain-containing protein n=1 Tax=Gimesia aquarii TaxID=2527964 RepID=A0A517WXM2_9PLAN|nr:hypothetical protein [Gimesia aquarii]QDU10009.1 hypothetical protein V202x_34060 [Gimesia aquarii]
MARNSHIGNNTLIDISALEYILLGDLLDLLEEADGDVGAWKWISEVLDTLLKTMPREFELQDEGGYMEEVLEEQPNWQAQVKNLYEERCELLVKLKELQTRMQAARPLKKIAGELRHDLRDWISCYIAHQRHERRLVQDAFNNDIGAAD